MQRRRRGDARSEGKIVRCSSRRRKSSQRQDQQADRVGKMVKLQEAENQIITSYEGYDHRPADSDIVMDAIDTHRARLGRAPRLVSADAAFYSAESERAAIVRGVKRVCIPNRSTKTLSASASRRSVGSATDRNGALVPRAASASQNADTASPAEMLEHLEPPKVTAGRSLTVHHRHSRIIGSTSRTPQVRIARVGTICCLNGASVVEFLRHIAFVGFG
jgi:hypothetical protein